MYKQRSLVRVKSPLLNMNPQLLCIKSINMNPKSIILTLDRPLLLTARGINTMNAH